MKSLLYENHRLLEIHGDATGDKNNENDNEVSSDSDSDCLDD